MSRIQTRPLDAPDSVQKSFEKVLKSSIISKSFPGSTHMFVRKVISRIRPLSVSKILIIDLKISYLFEQISLRG
jgi:hypothetical protein